MNLLTRGGLLAGQSPQAAARQMIAVIDSNDDGRLTAADDSRDWEQLKLFDANSDDEVSAEELAVSFTEALQPTGDPAKQIEMLSRFIQRDPKNASLYVQRSGVYRSQAKYDQALQDLNVAIELKPEDAPAYNSRAQVRIFLGDLEAARAIATARFRSIPSWAVPFTTAD